MNAQTRKEKVNEKSGTKIVETVDYRSSAGKGIEQTKVEVIHQPHFSDGSKSSTSGSVLAGAAAAAASSTLESAKNAFEFAKDALYKK